MADHDQQADDAVFLEDLELTDNELTDAVRGGVASIDPKAATSLDIGAPNTKATTLAKTDASDIKTMLDKLS